MQIKNADHGLHGTLVAVFKKQGLSDTQATAKATQNLEAARSVFDKATAPKSKPAPSSREIMLRDVRMAAPAPKSVASGRMRGPSIKSTSNKITKDEQTSLRKVQAPSRVKDLVESKPGSSLAIGRSAVAKWAAKLK